MAISATSWIISREFAGLETAERFLNRLMTTFADLAPTPLVGRRCHFTRPATRQLRQWRVQDFENWLIFYQPDIEGVEIVHVVHGARDLEDLFLQD